jgi:hypothetical protein
MTATHSLTAKTVDKESAMRSVRPARSPRFAARATVFAALLAAMSVAGPVSAASPGNDLAAGATTVTALPFAINQDTTEATVSTDDVGCGSGGLDQATVWYAFTPSDTVIVEVDARPSGYLVGVTLFIGSPDENGRADCNNDMLTFEADADTTYYLLFADVNDDGNNGGSLRADIHVAPPAVDVSLTVDPIARIHPKTGQARLTGTITCDREAAYAEVTATLRMGTGRFFTIGAGAGTTTCGPTPTSWATIVSGENGRFVAGSGTATVVGLACDAVACNESPMEASLKLRRGTFALPDGEVSTTAGLAPAAAPPNDAISAPTVIDTLPYRDELDTSGATIGATDPGYCFDPAMGADPASVWYSYTAGATGPILATTFDSEYDTSLYVGTPDGTGGIDVIACGDDTRNQQSAVRFDAVAGETYLFAASASPFGGSTGGSLVFNLDIGPPEQVVELKVNGRGSFDGYGTATIRGTVSCTAPAPIGAILIVELDQRVGNRHLPGNAFLDITDCPGTAIPFEAEVTSPYGKYRGGNATAQVIFAACAEFGCGNQTIDLTVGLRR